MRRGGEDEPVDVVLLEVLDAALLLEEVGGHLRLAHGDEVRLAEQAAAEGEPRQPVVRDRLGHVI